MIEMKLHTLYREIYKQVDTIIPENWNNVILYAECSAEHRKAFFYYYSADKDHPVCGSNIFEIFSIDVDYFIQLWGQLVEHIEELHHTFVAHNQEPWTNLTMRFDHTGKFSIEYHYDDFTELSPIESLSLWKYMQARIIPTDDYALKCLKELLSNYHTANKLFNNQPVYLIES